MAQQSDDSLLMGEAVLVCAVLCPAVAVIPCCFLSCQAHRASALAAPDAAVADSMERKSDSAAAAAPKALTVEQFYHLFHYVVQNAPILQHATAQLRSITHKQPHEQLAAAPSDTGAAADSEDSRVCSICLSADVEIALPCLHAFCSACIEDWHTHDQSCPLCRTRADVNDAGGDAWTDVWRLDGGSETELREVCETISSFPYHFLRDKPGFVE